MYAGAAATALVSLYEGFGLPILESLAAGTRVVCSDIPVFHEVAGGAARFVDPYDIESISAGLDAVVADRGVDSTVVRRSRGRTWRNVAADTRNFYSQLLQGELT
jgi:alpha-1,3-rhamnosyl/mannosyltransferase